MLVDCEVRGIYVVGAGGPGTMYCRYSLCVVLSWLEKVGIFLGVYRIGEARQVMNLTSLKLLQFVFSKIPATLTVGLIFMRRISPF